ncbi:hypothetical protein BHE74_00027064 [Ensete ventricosum]|nr:hypothetical protein BHE74_00027064 [Ensete ventricosum]RZS04963.1 hypothetical protein BHM03_00035379 [Ensete ventricosum]
MLSIVNLYVRYSHSLLSLSCSSCSNKDGKFLKAAKNVTSALNSAFPKISTKVVVEVCFFTLYFLPILVFHSISLLCLGYLFISFQPRKGCFKVHDEEGEIFLQHLVILLSWYHVMQDLEDPYTELESIDVSKVVKDVGRKIG